MSEGWNKPGVNDFVYPGYGERGQPDTGKTPPAVDPAITHAQEVAARAEVISAWDRVRAWGLSDKEAAQTFAGRLLALCHSSPSVASGVRGLLRDAGLVP